MDTPGGLPIITSRLYVALRPDRGVLTVQAVREARFHLGPGCHVVVSIYGLNRWQAGVPELLARIFADFGVAVVDIQASARAGLVDDLRDAISAAMADYVRVVE